jgi:hypothetical protein
MIITTNGGAANGHRPEGTASFGHGRKPWRVDGGTNA